MEKRQLAHVDVRVIVRRGDAILLLQRSDVLFPGHWNLPGGHVRPDEDALSAAERELREETGLNTTAAHLRFVGVSHFRPPTRVEKVSFAFECQEWTGLESVREPMKFAALAWWPTSSLPAPIMPQAKEALRLACSGDWFSTYGLGQDA